MASLDQYQSWSQVDTLKLLQDSNSELQLEVEQLKRENCELKLQLQHKESMECGGASDQKPPEIMKTNDEEGNEDLQNKVEVDMDSEMNSLQEELVKEIEGMMKTHHYKTFEKTEEYKMVIWEIFKKETSRLEALVREKEGYIETLESEREQVLNLMRELRVSSEFLEIERSPFLEQLEKVVVHIKKKLREYRGICKFLHDKLLNRASRGSAKRTAQTSSQEAISVSTQTSKRVRFTVPLPSPTSLSVLQDSSSNLSQPCPHAGPSPAATPSTSVTSAINVQEPSGTQTTMYPPPSPTEKNLTILLTKRREGQQLGKDVWKVVQVGTSSTSHSPKSPSGLIPPPGATLGVIDESQSNVSLPPVSPRGGDEETVDPILKAPPPLGQTQLIVSASKSSVSPEGITVTGIKCHGTMDTNESNHIPLATDPPPPQKEAEKDKEVDMETIVTDTFIPPHPLQTQTPLPTVHPSTSAFGSEPVLNETITRHTPPNLPTIQSNHQEVAHRISHELPSPSRKFQCKFCGNEFRSGENQNDHACPTLHSSKQPNLASIVDEDEDDDDVVILPTPFLPIIANKGVHNDYAEIIDLESPPPFIPARNDDLSNKSVEMETDTDNQEISIVQSSSSQDPNKTIFHAPFLVVQTLKNEDEEIDVETDTSPDQDQFTEARDGDDDSMTSNSTATAHRWNSPEPQANLPETYDNLSANLGPTTEPSPPQPFPSTSQSSSQTPVRNKTLHGVDSEKKNTCICRIPYINNALLQSLIEKRRGKNW